MEAMLRHERTNSTIGQGRRHFINPTQNKLTTLSIYVHRNRRRRSRSCIATQKASQSQRALRDIRTRVLRRRGLAHRRGLSGRQSPFAICLLVTRYHRGAARVVVYIPVQPSTPQTQGFPHQHPKAELSILHHHPPQFLNLKLRPSTIQPSLLFSALALKEVKGN
jgi:hypothetical protein